MEPNKHIFLMGFMGCGKTTVGKILATKLNKPFIDTDQEIENKAQKSIPEIFNSRGEPEFRAMEQQIITSLHRFSPAIIALGGGAILSHRNRNIIKNLGHSIYLNWPIETLYQRIKHCKNRPLLKQVSPEKLFDFISAMFTTRKQYYEQADIIINGNEFDSIDALTMAIIKRLMKIIRY